MIPRGLRVWVALAALHGIVVVLGAANLRVQERGAIGELVTWYGALTGAERGFGFFAPQVNTQARASFTIVDKDGHSFERSLEEGSSAESTLRINNLGSRFWQILDKGSLDLRHSMAASWAGKMFARYPQAKQVTVHFEVFQLYSMAEYRAGRIPHWTRLYDAVFSRTESL